MVLREGYSIHAELPVLLQSTLRSFFFQSHEIYTRARVACVIAGVIGMLASALAVLWICFGDKEWSSNSVVVLIGIFCFRFCSFAMTTYGFFAFKKDMLLHVIDLQDKREAFCGRVSWLPGSNKHGYGYEQVENSDSDHQVSNRKATSFTISNLPKETVVFALCFLCYLFFIIFFI